MKKPRQSPAGNHLPADSGTEYRYENDLPEMLHDDLLKLNSSRRDFLKYFGFSFASAAVLSACRRPVINAIPYSVQPPELTPRIPLYYASTYFDGHDYCSILVKTFDGRPIKIEGNALSRFNGEGTTARIQASVLSLYDDARLKYPEISNQRASWEDADRQITEKLGEINKEGGEIVLLTSSIISPSTIELIGRFGSAFSKFRWIEYDAVSYSAIIEANDMCFGMPVIPDYNFQNAAFVVSFNADFLGTWLSPVHFTPKYISQRKLNDGKKNMLLHVQYESGLSLTGSNADIRVKIRPSEEKIALTDLHNRIASETGGMAIPGQQFRQDLSDLAVKLLASKGRSIVVSGTNDTDIQVIVNSINNMLGNYDTCIDLRNNLRIAAGRDSEIEALVKDMNSGSVGALIMYNVNPAYDYPDNQSFLSGLEKTGLTINMSVSLNETSGRAVYECPVNHFLESWDDAEIIPGQLSLAQPGINPLFDTRSFQDSLLKWSGVNVSWHDFLEGQWKERYFPLSGVSDPDNFWKESLARGVFNYESPGTKIPSFNEQALKSVNSNPEKDSGGVFEVILNENVAMGSGIHANNPWLMELPDPVTRQCWENVASVSPRDAAEIGITDGQLLKITEGLRIPALIQPGQAEGTISIALGYGHNGSGPVAMNSGVNVFPYVRLTDGNRIYGFSTQMPVPEQETRELALVQIHSSMDGRPIVRDTVLSKYVDNPSSGNEIHEEFEKKHKTLYPEYVYEAFHWAMAIDLNACTGCNTCVIACQAENNTPTVGREEVRRNRIMHWIKVHRYYSEGDDPKVYFQPVFCQHCDNAPCENVCPVSATNHNNEGLNQMSYNRCVGTKYCMNNCPYRVRRFNWFRYTDNIAFNYNTASDLGRMVLNPDVTVRERGVVEKCTFCVQRIQAKKLQARLEGRVLQDMEIKPACMQACPAGAIIFGNLNDRNSLVSSILDQPRRYQLLEELHTLPTIGFLTRVRNDGIIS